jgi:hypothetical protein
VGQIRRLSERTQGETVESPPFRGGQVGQHVVRDASDHSLTAREGAPTGGRQCKQVAAAIRPIAVSDDMSKLLQLVHEPDHVASIHHDRVAHLLLGNLAELGKTAEDLVGAKRQALPCERIIELTRGRAG